ncbi:TPA: hypothetical protein OMF04_005618, partial [Klebsiella pneumoniae]
YLEITMSIADENRAAAAAVYKKYKQPFLDTIKGAETKQLLIRDQDVQVLHGFENAENAAAYLDTELFKQDVFVELKPYIIDQPDVRVYDAN